MRTETTSLHVTVMPVFLPLPMCVNLRSICVVCTEVTNTTLNFTVRVMGILEGSDTAQVVSNNISLNLDPNRVIETVERDFTVEQHKYSRLYFQFESQDTRLVPFGLVFDALPASGRYQTVFAGIILVFVYVLIVFELVHRTIAAMIGSLLALMTLSLLNKRPSLDKTVEWIDYETIGLLFGMMTLVGVFSTTGVFDWLALKAYKLAKGKVWPLITILCFFSGIVSAFLDNVTTILLLTPVSIRLCQVLNLDPTRVLMAEVVFSNIGGTATAVGDPPNVIIVSNKAILEAGITFSTFTLHLFIGITFCMVGAYGLLRLMYRKLDLANEDPPDIAELKREVQVWRRTASRVPMVSAEQKAIRALLMQKMLETEQRLRDLRSSRAQSTERWKENLSELEQKYRITDFPLLVKSCIVLVVVVVFFFAHSAPAIHMGLGWIALLGGVWLLVLADVHDLEVMLEKIEWATLLFFAALFILMEALGELKLIQFLGDETSQLIQGVPEGSRLTVAIIAILWLSAICSSFIDNIPFTTAMIPVVVSLGSDADVGIPLPPLVWALAMGACLGGNGTLIGASANVVCAGIAEQHGYPISFNQFFKIGFPMMLVTTAIAMVYLLICHSALGWNSP
eukprot:scpid40150/ scgid6202/ P protein; Melanocyte-specific transporter protein; Pink-eyed dilution protein homolog